MAQPKWKLLANLGDASPLDYGGLFVLVDETGVYPPELEKLEEPCEDDKGGSFTVYRVVLDKCTYQNGILSDNRFHPEHAAWFADSADRIASFVGMEHHDLVRLLCSSDPLELAEGYRCVFDYHGWDEGDSYPLKLSRKEARARIRKLGLK